MSEFICIKSEQLVAARLRHNLATRLLCWRHSMCVFFSVEVQDIESAQLMQSVDNLLAVDKLWVFRLGLVTAHSEWVFMRPIWQMQVR